MEARRQRPHPAAEAGASTDCIAITLFAPNDDDNNPRLLRLVLSSEDGVLAAVEDGDEDGALERAGFDGCATGPYFYVDATEYERILDMWGSVPA